MISHHLKNHLDDNFPQKPLVISFFGPPGTGKTFISQIIANHTYREAARNHCTNIYYGNLGFTNEKKKVEYQKKLLKDVMLSRLNCERPLYIFDDIDKMSPGVIDIFEPYFTVPRQRSSVDLRKSTFIFISNSGAEKLNEIAFNAYLDDIDREDMNFEDFSSHLKEAAYDTEGGLWHSEIVKKDLIDLFVPFLPLERKHVYKCIVRELQNQNLPYFKHLVKDISKRLEYNPPGFEIYSVSGCKEVPLKSVKH